MKRIKTQGVNPESDAMLHFVHHDDVLQCYMFLLFYYLVTNPVKTTKDSSIFPNWDIHINLCKKNGTDSKVSGEFRRFWKKMFQLCENYVMEKGNLNADFNEYELQDIIEKYCLQEMSENQTSHGGKKRGIQDIADGGLSPQVQ